MAIIPLIATGVGAALSFLGEQDRRREEDRARQAQIDALEEAKISPGEAQRLESNVNRRFNVLGSSDANRTAFGSSAVLNPDTIRGLTASTLLGKRGQALTDLDTRITERNSQLDAQIAGVTPTRGINIGNVIGGGLTGFELGESINQLNPDLGDDIGDFFSEEPTGEFSERLNTGGANIENTDLFGSGIAENLQMQLPIQNALPEPSNSVSFMNSLKFDEGLFDFQDPTSELYRR